MNDKYTMLAARWVCKMANVGFPDDVAGAYLDFRTGFGGFCDTCSFEYTYVVAWVYRPNDAPIRAEYNPGNPVEMSDILAGMAELDEEAGVE